MNDVDQRLKEIVEFLKYTHPSLMEPLKSRECIELRPIARMKETPYSFKRSLNLWDLNEKSIQRLKNFLIKHESSNCCLYYSIYTFDYDKVSYLKNGKLAKKGKINSDNAAYTEEIVLDFDNISHEDYKTFSNNLKSQGIEGLWVNSGHGFQFHLLLKDKSYDKQLLKEFVHLFREKGYPCDEACIDPARVMRLPYTYNHKGLVDAKYENEINDPPTSYIVEKTLQRYHLEELINKLKEVSTKKSLKPTKIGQKKKTMDSLSTKEESIAIHKLTYPFIDHYNLPDAICKMLNSTPDGYRNKALGFLIRYFKVYMKLGKSQMEEILTKWANEACQPSYNQTEFKEDFARLYYYNGLNYDADLAHKFGFVDFQNLNLITKQQIFIPNTFLTKMNQIDGNAVRAYLAVKLVEHLEKETNIDEIAAVLNLTTRAVRPTLKKLLESKDIYLVKGNRRLKESNRYLTTKITDLSKGYLKLSFNDVKSLIDELAVGELKLYLFMSYRFFNGDCFMSQNNIGKHIGLEQNTISELTKQLENKYYLKITKIPLAQSKSGVLIYSCRYSLLR